MKILYCILFLSSIIFSQTEKLKDEVFNCSVLNESLPEPIGGLDSIQAKLIYPKDAVINKIEGRVLVITEIDSLGKVVNTSIHKGIGYGCDEEAMRVINSTLFKPSLVNGKPMEVKVLIPIKFKLE